MRRVRQSEFGLALGVAILLLAACGGGTTANTPASTSTNTPATSSGGMTVVRSATATVGGMNETVLTNTQGRTLYYFDPDTASSVACTGLCASIWPPLLLSAGTPQSSAQLAGTLSTRQDSLGRQVTYNGHPLYTYSGDSKPGDTNGNGIQGKWHVATPSIAVLGGTTPSPSGSSNGGYGY